MSRILVVEDDADPANLALHWLERAGHAVQRVADGSTALRAIEGEPLPDLVLLDVMLPKMDGFDLLSRIRADARTRRLPVILVTRLPRANDAARGRELGANDYIVKPLVELDFLKRVEHILND